MMMISRSLIYAALYSAVTASPALADCAARFEALGPVTLPLYNPFSPVDLAAHVQLGVRNMGQAPCRYHVYFSRTPADGLFGQDIHYTIADQNGASLLVSSANPLDANHFAATADIAPGQTGQLDVEVDVGRGQIAGGGTYADNVIAVLFAENGTAELDRQTLGLTLPVASVSSVNIAGGGVSTSVNFGTLEAGKSRSVMIQARSNEPYEIRFASTYGGRLRLDPAPVGRDWWIDYQMDVDGVVTSLAGGGVLTTDAPASGEQNHTLSFRIVDAAGKRAGIYKDVITATILTIH